MRNLLGLAFVAFASCANTSGTAQAADPKTCEPQQPPVGVTGAPEFGGGSPGDACKTHSDCAGLCCTCSAKPNEKFLASECVNDNCADNKTACADEEQLLTSQGFGDTICP